MVCQGIFSLPSPWGTNVATQSIECAADDGSISSRNVPVPLVFHIEPWGGGRGASYPDVSCGKMKMMARRCEIMCSIFFTSLPLSLAHRPWSLFHRSSFISSSCRRSSSRRATHSEKRYIPASIVPYLVLH